jgi:hypothetical protein
MYECPGLMLLDGDGLLHRDPLFSLLESRWRKGDINSPVNFELMLAYIQTMTDVDVLWLENSKLRFHQLAKMFSELKQAEAKRNSVKSENLQIPTSCDEAIYISWDGSGNGGGLGLNSISQKLKRLKEHWKENIEAISELIDQASVEGSDKCTVRLQFGEDLWCLKLGYRGTVGACTPELLAEELISADYQVKFDVVNLDENTFDVIQRQPLSISGVSQFTKPGDYEMIIEWMHEDSPICE